MARLDKQLENYRLITAKILYHLPDFEALLQEFIWQDYDRAPDFPVLHGFLGFWEEEIEGRLHSVYVARQELITPGDSRFADWEGVLQ
ncbi:MAG: Usg family protein [Alphaproteobacteria bacterium]|nr:Usg family protein [Alphaproteobacteria bacterium]